MLAAMEAMGAAAEATTTATATANGTEAAAASNGTVTDTTNPTPRSVLQVHSSGNGIPAVVTTTASPDVSGSTRQAAADDEDADGALAPPATPTPRQPPRAMATELYTRIAQVGEGTYGQVFKARSEHTGIFVALKKIRMEAEKDGFPITAMREIKLLQMLRHPNVVRLHEMMTARSESEAEGPWTNETICCIVSIDLLTYYSFSRFRARQTRCTWSLSTWSTTSTAC